MKKQILYNIYGFILVLISIYFMLLVGSLDEKGSFFTDEELKYSSNIASLGEGRHRISELYPGKWNYVCEATAYFGDLREDIKRWSDVDISHVSPPLRWCKLNILGGCDYAYTVFIRKNNVKILRYAKYSKLNKIIQINNGCWCYNTASAVIKNNTVGKEKALRLRIEGRNVKSSGC